MVRQSTYFNPLNSALLGEAFQFVPDFQNNPAQTHTDTQTHTTDSLVLTHTEICIWSHIMARRKKGVSQHWQCSQEAVTSKTQERSRHNDSYGVVQQGSGQFVMIIE